MSDETDSKLRVERSPRAPILPLKIALQRAEKLYDLARAYPAPVREALKQWGYSPKSSGGLQTVATLKMYGLAQDIGSGDERKIQLTKEAIDYLIDERPERRLEARRSFALRPKILGLLWKEWRADPPSAPIARSQLRLEHGFTEKAANDLIKIYQENLQFAGLREAAEEPEAGEEELEAGNGAAADVSIGDYVQWQSDGRFQFDQPRRVTVISGDGSEVGVEGIRKFIPVSEVRKARPPSPWAQLLTATRAASMVEASGQPYQIMLTGDGLRVVASVDKAGLKKLIRVLKAQLALMEEEEATGGAKPGAEE